MSHYQGQYRPRDRRTLHVMNKYSCTCTNIHVHTCTLKFTRKEEKTKKRGEIKTHSSGAFRILYKEGVKQEMKNSKGGKAMYIHLGQDFTGFVVRGGN